MMEKVQKSNNKIIKIKPNQTVKLKEYKIFSPLFFCSIITIMIIYSNHLTQNLRNKIWIRLEQEPLLILITWKRSPRLHKNLQFSHIYQIDFQKAEDNKKETIYLWLKPHMHLKMIVYLLPAWNLSIQEFCIHKDLQDPINSIKIENSAKTTKEIMILKTQ